MASPRGSRIADASPDAEDISYALAASLHWMLLLLLCTRKDVL